MTEKILFQHEIFGHERFLLQLSVGTLPHAEMLRAIELYGTEVAPAVRAALAPQRRSRQPDRATLFPRGAIAQLGERLDRTQEVSGSSPLSST